MNTQNPIFGPSKGQAATQTLSERFLLKALERLQAGKPYGNYLGAARIALRIEDWNLRAERRKARKAARAGGRGASA